MISKISSYTQRINVLFCFFFEKLMNISNKTNKIKRDKHNKNDVNQKWSLIFDNEQQNAS